MNVAPHGAGGARIALDAPSAQVLSGLIADLVGALAPNVLSRDDPVYQRLFPDGYGDDDAEAAAEFRALTEDSLRAERAARAQACVADLQTEPGRRGRIVVTLDADGVRRWLRVLNDLRLALGTRVGVSEDEDAMAELAANSAYAQPLAAYGYLTALQDSLVNAAMR